LIKRGRMEDYIKFQDLSNEIKNLIKKYHKSLADEVDGLSLEEAMSKWFRDEFEGWLKDRCGEPPLDDRRKHVRLDIEVPVRIVETLIESTTEESDALELVGTILNISRGGFYFKSSNPINVSSVIEVSIDFPSIDNKINTVDALAMVVRNVKLSKHEYGIGVMFSTIYDEHKKNVDLFIFKNLAYKLYSE